MHQMLRVGTNLVRFMQPTTMLLGMYGFLAIYTCDFNNRCFTRSHASKIAKSTGCKSSYSLMNLPNHNPLEQTVPDAMHTVKDVIENLFGLIMGRRDSFKVHEAERKLGRLNLIDTPLPYRLSKDQLHLADKRLLSARFPAHLDYKPKQMFTKKLHMKSHDWKQVCIIIFSLHKNYTFKY